MPRSTLNRWIDAFEALRARAEFYRTILNMQVKERDQQLDVLAKSVEQLLGSKMAA